MKRQLNKKEKELSERQLDRMDELIEEAVREVDYQESILRYLPTLNKRTAKSHEEKRAKAENDLKSYKMNKEILQEQLKHGVEIKEKK